MPLKTATVNKGVGPGADQDCIEKARVQDENRENHWYQGRDHPRPPPLCTAGSRPAPPEGLRYKEEVLPALHQATYISQPSLFGMLDKADQFYIDEEIIRDAAHFLQNQALRDLDERKKRRAKIFKAKYP